MSKYRYLVELGLALFAYIALLVGSLFVLPQVSDPLARTLVALSPMLPAVLLVFTVVRQLRRIDEFQQRIQLEALGLAFAGTAVLSFGYGFLENVGFPELTMFAVWPLMATLWVIGLCISHLRYR